MSYGQRLTHDFHIRIMITTPKSKYIIGTLVEFNLYTVKHLKNTRTNENHNFIFLNKREPQPY